MILIKSSNSNTVRGKINRDIELKTDKEWINELLEKY
jgi:hypothetical protein